MYSFNFCWFSLSRHHKNLKKNMSHRVFFFLYKNNVYEYLSSYENYSDCEILTDWSSL